jgi:putative ABC transport system substrate-binding protein
MKRRAILLGGASALGLAPLRVLGQPAGRVHRIGVLLPMAGLAAEPYLAALRQRLRVQGFTDGANLRIEVRLGGSASDARELAALKLDAALACTSSLATAMHSAARQLPLVFVWVSDPVQTGLVQSYARPGGWVTGVTSPYFELAQKRVELLRELLPGAKRVALVAGFYNAAIHQALAHAQAAAGRLRLELLPIEALGDWQGAYARALAADAQAILVLTPFDIFGMRFAAEETVRFSIGRRVPIVFSDAGSVERGGLLAYGSDPLAELRQASDLLARVLKGEKAADMPVELASRFQLAVNLKTARAIGVEVPRSIVLRADRVIE